MKSGNSVYQFLYFIIIMVGFILSLFLIVRRIWEQEQVVNLALSMDTVTLLDETFLFLPEINSPSRSNTPRLYPSVSQLEV